MFLRKQVPKQSGALESAGSSGVSVLETGDGKWIQEFATEPLKLRRFRRNCNLDQPEKLGSVLVILLSYNCKEDSLECLESISRQTYADLGLVIIDNASTDGAPGAIRAADSGVSLISLSENRGWAGGNNLGIKIAVESGFD